MKTKIILLITFLTYIGMHSPVQAQQKKVIKTMMIAGADGSHYWQGACEAMKQILENSGMFRVDFAFTPPPTLVVTSIPSSRTSANMIW